MPDSNWSGDLNLTNRQKVTEDHTANIDSRINMLAKMKASGVAIYDYPPESELVNNNNKGYAVTVVSGNYSTTTVNSWVTLDDDLAVTLTTNGGRVLLLVTFHGGFNGSPTGFTQLELGLLDVSNNIHVGGSDLTYPLFITNVAVLKTYEQQIQAVAQNVPAGTNTFKFRVKVSATTAEWGVWADTAGLTRIEAIEL